MLALSINVGITFLLVICCAILFGSLKNSQSATYVGVLRPLLHRLKIAKHIRERFRDTNTLPDCLASLDLARNGYGADALDGTLDALSSLVDNLEGEGEGDERLFGIRCFFLPTAEAGMQRALFVRDATRGDCGIAHKR